MNEPAIRLIGTGGTIDCYRIECVETRIMIVHGTETLVAKVARAIR
jgi:hypothetical protein